MVLLGDGKIEEPLALVNDFAYKVGSKLNCRVMNDIKNGFFDEDCERKRQEVLEALRKARDRIDSRENTRFYMDYKLIRNKYKKMLKIKKKENEIRTGEQLKKDYREGDIRTFWRRPIVKNSIGGKEVCDGIPAVDSWPTYLEERENEVIRDQGGTSLSVDLVSALRDVVDRPIQEFYYDLVAPIQVSEVWETMKGMKSESAPDIDGIPIRRLLENN